MTIHDVPECVANWLVAQGLEVISIRQDNTTVPATELFTLRMQEIS